MNAKLAELRQTIRRNAKYIDKKPDARTIAWMALQQIEHIFGSAEANQAIHDFKLGRKGFEESE